MDSVQVGKAVFVKVSFASLGFEPRTFSYPGSCATNTLLAKNFLECDSSSTQYNTESEIVF